MAESYFMVYIIERRGPRQRVFGPVPGYGAFCTKREALQKCRELTKETPANEYRARSYWDKRPW